MNTPEHSLRRMILMVAVLASFITPFMGSAANLALPRIGETFLMSAAALSWVQTSFLLSTAVFLVPIGRLSDIQGRKKLFALGMAVFAAGSALAGLAFSASILIGARVLQGLGSSMIFSNGMAILTSVYPPQDRGRVLGWNVAAVYIGLSSGPILGGLLTQYLTWRSVFLVPAPLCLAVAAAVARRPEEWAGAKGEKFDLAGSLIYAGAITAFAYGLTRLPDPAGFGLMVPGLAGLAAFVIWERRVKSPVFPISLFTQNRVFAFSSLAALLHYSATFALTFLMSLYLQYIKALSPRDAGLVIIAQPIMMALFSPLAGRISDRIEPRVVASLGMAMTGTGLLLLAFLGQDTPLPIVIAELALVGIGFAAFSSPNTNAIMGAVEKKHYGLASAAVGVMRMIGQMASMGIATMVITHFLGHEKIAPPLYPAFLRAFTSVLFILVGLCVIGLFASLVRGNRNQNHVVE